jgi:hypothetical protein
MLATFPNEAKLARCQGRDNQPASVQLETHPRCVRRCGVSYKADTFAPIVQDILWRINNRVYETDEHSSRLFFGRQQKRQRRRAFPTDAAPGTQNHHAETR